MKSQYGSRFLPVEAIAHLLENFQEGRHARVAGRLMARRIMGKTTFCDLKDESGRIQIYAKKDELAEDYEAFTALTIGDILGVEGSLFASKTGEKTVRIEKFQLLSKIVRGLPEKWHGLKDIEIRLGQGARIHGQVVDASGAGLHLLAIQRRSQLDRRYCNVGMTSQVRQHREYGLQTPNRRCRRAYTGKTDFLKADIFHWINPFLTSSPRSLTSPGGTSGNL